MTAGCRKIVGRVTLMLRIGDVGQDAFRQLLHRKVARPPFLVTLNLFRGPFRRIERRLMGHDGC